MWDLYLWEEANPPSLRSSVAYIAPQVSCLDINICQVDGPHVLWGDPSLSPLH
jgi:hypothetical protein